MAIIDLTINDPALKRTEVVSPDTDSDTVATESQSTEGAPTGDTAKSGGRLRRVAGATGALAVGVVGLLTFGKLRARRKKS